MSFLSSQKVPNKTAAVLRSLEPKYRALVDKGGFEEDSAQLLVVSHLESLIQDLAERKLANKSNSLGWLFHKRRSAWSDAMGLYIWGSVGRGKTMLMDLFFEAANIRRKRRMHFHGFMTDVHERINRHRDALKQGLVSSDDPIVPVANQIADEVRLLCLDEFMVRDVADAMIMRRLFTQLFKRNVVMVATSNVEPDSLYEDGLQRDDFLPFICLLKENLQISRLEARTDFRLEKLGNKPVYSTPLNAASRAQVEALWREMTGGRRTCNMTLQVKGRPILVPAATLGIARFSFDDLCARPFGNADYMKIAENFHTVFIENIPKFSDESRNEAKRFINLIDSFYDMAVKLVVSAAALPAQLNQGLRAVEAFEFDRTVSRLVEMQSDAYMRKKRR